METETTGEEGLRRRIFSEVDEGELIESELAEQALKLEHEQRMAELRARVNAELQGKLW